VAPGVPVTFHTVLESARRRNEVALGYRLRAEGSNPKAAYGIRVNPRKSAAITFSEGDRVIVLADA
jgi:ABC-type uncharacterized transport system permease subunit